MFANEIGDQYLLLKEQIEDLLDKSGNSVLPTPLTTTGVADAGGRLAIVVGHTAKAQGASAVAPINASEYPWNTDLANRIVAECVAAGLSCKVFLRDSVGISGAYNAVEKWNASACIELHFNASDGTARGTETLYGVACTDSLKWAERIQAAMARLYNRTGKQDRGLRKCPPYKRGSESVNAMDGIPSCLIEPFFGDNAKDAKLGHDFKQTLAKALVQEFAAHFKTKIKTAVAAVPVSAKLSENDKFEALINSLGLRYFAAKEILRPTYNVNAGVANSRPPERLWHNILPTLMVLDEIRHVAGVPISLNSTYRSKAYNNTLSGAAAKSQHLDFRAIDFASSKMKPSVLVKIARKMYGKKFTIPVASLSLLKELAPFNAKGLKIKAENGATTFEYHGGISEYPSFVHIDCRGDDQTWG